MVMRSANLTNMVADKTRRIIYFQLMFTPFVINLTPFFHRFGQVSRLANSIVR